MIPFPQLSRRRLLQQASVGFGVVAFQGLRALRAEAPAALPADALPADAALSRYHHAPRAKHVIFCYMSGGVSHVDSFDPKPRLQQDHGKPMPVKVERTQFNNNGNIMASPFTFAPAGKSGLAISSMFPQLAQVADELAVVRSMTTSVNEHAQGNFFAHSGFPFMGHPSAGAWTTYGLGSENDELPGFVVLQSGKAVPPHGGVSLYSNGFLPGQYQGTILQADGGVAIRNLAPPDPQRDQRRRLDLVRALDQRFADRTSQDAEIEAAIRNDEIAYRMQAAVPQLCDLSQESSATHQLYGTDVADPELAAYARQCLLARRLVERGVRFVELSCLSRGIGAGNGPNPWDQHGDLQRGHAAMALQVDQPIAALLQDLRQRGLLEETLVIWAGEFGRTSFSQGGSGRDHNPFGFSIWIAGGGVRGGTVYGATDELGYYAVENPCTFYDLWATVLHQLGVDHERLTYRSGGRDFRLTDVHGRVLHSILS